MPDRNAKVIAEHKLRRLDAVSLLLVFTDAGVATVDGLEGNLELQTEMRNALLDAMRTLGVTQSEIEQGIERANMALGTAAELAALEASAVSDE